MSVFDNSPEEDDEDQSPGVRVAGALTGDGEEAPEEDAPQAQQPQGMVDGSGQSYLTPADADENGQPTPATNDEPVSADTRAYATPIAPPTLASPKPLADHSADYAAKTAQAAQEATENTKPSVWRRVAAGLAAGAVGYGTHNADEGMRVGQEITGAPLANAQHRWAMEEAPINSRIAADQAADAATQRANATTEQTNRTAESNYRNQILGQQDAARAENYQAQAEARKNAITAFTPDDPANPYAGGTGTTADGRTIKGVPPPDKWIANWEKNPDNVATAKANAGVKTLKALEASGVKLTPEQRAIVASGGKITPAVHTNISILENPDGSARTPAGASDPEAMIAKSMQDKDAFLSDWTRVDKDHASATSPEGSYMYTGPNTMQIGNTMTPAQMQEKIEKFRTDLNANPVMRKSGTMVDEQGRTVTNRFSRNPQTQQPAVQPQSPASQQQPVYKAKSGATVTVGTHVMVQGRPGVVSGFDAKGKPVVKY